MRSTVVSRDESLPLSAALSMFAQMRTVLTRVMSSCGS